MQQGTLTTGGARPPAAHLGPGVTARTIAVGCPYYPSANSSVAGMGGTFDTGNELAQWKAVLADLNRRGGIMGRQVICLYHAYDTASSATPDSMYQAACSDWTEDHHVLAILDHPVNLLIPECASKAGAAVIMDGLDSFRTATHRRYPELISDSVDIDRTALVTLERLHQTRFLGGSNRIGILYATDEPDVADELPVMQREAKSQGLNIVSTYGMPELDTGQAASGGNTAALQFRQNGVDRVLSLESGGGLALYFMIAADNQRYYPRYGWNSQNNIGAISASGAVPAAQLVGSQGVGWQPIYDISYGQDPSARGTSGRRRCLRIMNDAGLTATNYSTEFLMAAKCDKLWLLAAALGTQAAISRGPNGDGIVAGVESLGSSFESALTIGSDYGPARHDGVAEARDFAYLTTCSCFEYTSSPYSVD